MTITQRELEKYSSTISVERLLSFKQDENDTVEMLISRYKNNILMAQALYPELYTLEITLRNAINTMLKTCVSMTWIEDEITKQSLLFDYEHEILMSAYNGLKKDFPSSRVTTGQIIADLPFGFWTNICSKKYNSKIWTKKGCFKGVFVNYPSTLKQQIHIVSAKLHSARKLRNRVFHYEPITKNPIFLISRYNEILEVLSYLPNDGSSILKDTSTFLKVYNSIVAPNKAKT